MTETNDVYIDYKTNDSIEIFCVGDMHVGNKNFNQKLFIKTIDYIEKTPNCYMIGMGDYAEYIVGTDPRFELESYDIRFINHKKQSEFVTQQFARIKDKILILMKGNHEDKMDKFNHHTIVQDICKELDVKFGSCDAFTTLHFSRGSHKTNIDIYTMHGSGGGSLKGAKLNKIERFSEWINADIFLMGHFHVLLFSNSIVLKKRGKKVIEDDRFYGVTGSYLSGYKEGTTSYVNKMLLKPHKLGCLVLTIKPETRKISGSFFTGD